MSGCSHVSEACIRRASSGPERQSPCKTGIALVFLCSCALSSHHWVHKTHVRYGYQRGLLAVTYCGQREVLLNRLPPPFLAGNTCTTQGVSLGGPSDIKANCTVCNPPYAAATFEVFPLYSLILCYIPGALVLLLRSSCFTGAASGYIYTSWMFKEGHSLTCMTSSNC